MRVSKSTAYATPPLSTVERSPARSCVVVVLEADARCFQAHRTRSPRRAPAGVARAQARDRSPPGLVDRLQFDPRVRLAGAQVGETLARRRSRAAAETRSGSRDLVIRSRPARR